MAVAALVRATGIGAEMRAQLGFGFTPPDGELSEAASLAFHNMRLAAAALLAAAVVMRFPRARRPFDLALGLLAFLNATALGLAFGAYGLRLAAAVALHLPLEAVAFSLAGGVYLTAARAALSGRQLAACAALSALLLLAAALAESFFALGGPP